MTAQVPETILFDGREESLFSCPGLPEDHPRLGSGEPSDDLRDVVLITTACWRGYRGTWSIENGHLYLVDLKGRYRLIGDEPLLADWYSGELRICRGEQLHYVHMGFGSVYEKDLLITVERGRVLDTRVRDNRNREHDLQALAWKNLPGRQTGVPDEEPH